VSPAEASDGRGADAPPGHVPLPAGFRVVLDPATRVLDDGPTVVGGRPRRALRLSAAGAGVLSDLRDGRPVGDAGRILARRLVDAGATHPVPPPGTGDPSAVTVVIPVRDRPRELERCLAALAGHPRVVVVDDGSADPAAVLGVADAAGATVLRRATSGGPAAARNLALRHVRTPLVAFLDSDCVPPPGWLDLLVGHLEDPAVAAVAPRVRGRDPRAADVSPGTASRDGVRPSWAVRWGVARSPLDLGTAPARVVPGTAVSYVPTAALVVRRSALGDGFDEALRHGEDVDLVWRLHDAGWTVRYQPAVVVAHEEPDAWRPFLVRRYRYGTSAGPLARRHGERLAPVVLAPGPTATVALLLAGRPRAAGLLLAARAVRTTRSLRGLGVPRATGTTAAVRETAQTLEGVARIGAMLAPAPLLALAVARSGTRRTIAGLLVGAPLVRWSVAARSGRTAGLDPLRWTAASLADDAAYGTGVWVGALRSRAPWALRPSVVTARRGAAGR